MTTSQQFRLILERPDPDADRPAAGPAAFDCLEVPAGVSYLTVGAGGRPELSAEAPASADAAFVVEPIVRGTKPYLLLLSPAGRRVRVNGRPAPRAAVLRVQDQLQAGGDYALHVTLYNRPHVGPPEAGQVGGECPVCRTPVQEGRLVYVCPSCATALHCEGEERPREERLECARMTSQCPRCEAAVVLTQGYAYVPELCG